MEVRVLGPIEVVDGSKPLSGLRQRQLLALLVSARGRTVSTDRLLDALWGDNSRPARHALHTAISTLRGLLGERLQTTASGYTLQLTASELDLARFETLATRALQLGASDPDQAGAAARQALALWRDNPYLEVADEPWIQEGTTRLEQLRLACWEWAIEAELQQGRPERVLAEVVELTSRYPLYEVFWGQRMRALAMAGRRSDALAAYQEVRRILAVELGIEPSAPLQDLEHAILEGRVTARSGAVTRPPSLPLPLGRFVGRDEELARLQGLVSVHRVVTLVGPGGVGKTRLALEAAREMENRFPDGVVLVELSALSNPASLPTLMLRALGEAEETGRGVGETVLRHLSEKQALIILDTCEHMVEAAADFTRRVVERCHRVRVLATSQERLALVGEQVIRLEPLSTEPSAAAAVELFSDRAEGVRGGRPFDADERRLAAEVCETLDGLPLAIELAAAHAHTLTVAEIVEHLRDPLPTLHSRVRGVTERHRSIEAAIAWSVSLLPDDQQKTLQAVSVFQGKFSAVDAGAVLAAVGLGETGELLDNLAERSLLTVRARHPTRYSLLDTIREFARREAARSGLAPRAAAAHREHFMRFAREANAGLLVDEAAWYPRLDAVHAELEAVFEDLIGSSVAESALSMAAALGAYFAFDLRKMNQGLEWLEIAVAAAERASVPVKPAVIGYGLLSLGIHLCYQSRMEEGWDRLDQAGNVFGEAGVASGTTWTRFAQSQFPRSGLPEEAVEHARVGAAIAREQGDPVALGYTVTRLAEATLLRATVNGPPSPEEIARVAALCSEAAPFCAGFPRTFLSFHRLWLSGVTRALQGEVEPGLDTAEEAMAKGSEHGNGMPCATQAAATALLLVRLGRPERAVPHLRFALTAWRERTGARGPGVPARPALTATAAIAADTDPCGAAQLLGAAASFPASLALGAGIFPHAAPVERALEARLGHAAFGEARAIGADLRTSEVIDLAFVALDHQ